MVGNVLLLKHAESVPQSALAFARLFEEAGAPAGVYTNIFASIEQTERLVEDPRVRGVTLTGSERAGAAVAGRAGRSLKKSVMELGGSDPLIVLVKLARKEGGKVAFGGGRIDRPGFYLEPTVLTGISENNPIRVQELFGPVVSFYVVENENEAVSLANATSFGLGASVFTADIEHGRKVAAKIESGMVFINQPVWTAAQLPFGGVKNSGFRRELSELGFGEFVNEKLINVAPPGSPPCGPVR